MAYATYSDLKARFDENVIRDLASDTGEPTQDPSNSTIITTALSDASGDINSAVMVADHYTAAELAALTSDDLAYLKRLTCELAMGYLLGRRPEKYSDDGVKKVVQHAREALEMLRQGKHLFNVTAHKTAGQPNIDGPTTADYDRLNMIPERCRPYYPSRGSRLPQGRTS